MVKQASVDKECDNVVFLVAMAKKDGVDEHVSGDGMKDQDATHIIPVCESNNVDGSSCNQVPSADVSISCETYLEKASADFEDTDQLSIGQLVVQHEDGGEDDHDPSSSPLGALCLVDVYEGDADKENSPPLGAMRASCSNTSPVASPLWNQLASKNTTCPSLPCDARGNDSLPRAKKSRFGKITSPLCKRRRVPLRDITSTVVQGVTDSSMPAAAPYTLVSTYRRNDQTRSLRFGMR